MNIIKIAIADDHTLFRQLLIQYLEEFNDINIVLEASNGRDLITLTTRFKPDVLLLDLKMPDIDGFMVLDHFKEHYPTIKIIVLSMFDEAYLVKSAFARGAHAYLTKNTEMNIMIRAIRNAANDIRSASNRKSTVKTITRRQKEILLMLSRGFTAKVIAKRLSISPRTVEDHKDNMLRHFEAKNIAHLIKIVTQKGILDFA